MVIGLVSILLLFAGVQSRMNRRRWTAHLAYLESLGEGDEDEGGDGDEGSDLPAPVTAVEEEESDDYEDDEIELV